MQPKVFGIGFQKTGTSSLGEALEHLGYSVIDYFGTTLPLDELRARYVELGLELAQKYDAVQDMPWPLMFRELDQAFPGAKFILTERDADTWYDSMVKHFGETPTPMRQMTYGEDAPAPAGNKERYHEVYLAHNDTVKAYFADRPNDFLILNLEKGDGWRELGAFLNRTDVPEGSFVHANKAEKRKTLGYQLERLKTRVKRKLGLMPDGKG